MVLSRHIMSSVYVVHYHEIALKGRNRPIFLRQLQKNICRATGLPLKSVKIASGRLIVDEQVNIEDKVKCIFGISSFSAAVLVKAEYTEIEREVLSYALEQKFETFAISATRGDKRFKMTSKDLEIKLGDAVRTRLKRKVDLNNPDRTFYVEVFKEGAVVYIGKNSGAGGMPVGTQLPVAVLLSGGIDSPVAAHRIMKRGAPVVGIHFHSYPFTSHASIDKVKEIGSVLARYGGMRKLYLVSLGEAQKEVVRVAQEKYRVLLYRRLMLRIAEVFAKQEGAQALVTGESLGQVASQTLENMRAVEAAATLPVFRPLIGYDKEEIIAEARRIGTFGISILPDADCCTLFMPKNPATRARIEDLDAEERKLPLKRLIDVCLHSTLSQHL